MTLLFLAFAGALGAASRYGCGLIAALFFEKGSPWGIAAINVFGCFLFGIVVAAFEGRPRWNPEWKTVLLTGFLGSFTTFSTYLFDIQSLILQKMYARALLSFVAQNSLGLLGMTLGLSIASVLFGSK